ncbi:MAG: hypothetical protein JW795_01385 [Chitinivibrionales bacterium]|nr:hypothetical protein [Chitinivibrionales bacterium]
MIRTIKIKCPYCHEISELFLSMNPTVIVLNCPECWTPIMYDKHEIRILSAHEISKIATAPSSQNAINSFFDKITKKNIVIEETDTCGNNGSLMNEVAPEPLALPAPPQPEEATCADRDYISVDDVVDLQISLSQCNDVLEFIAQC